MFDLTLFYRAADEECGGTEGCGEHDFEDEQTLVMVDEETGVEYTFEIVDHFSFNGEMYTVLVTEEDEDGEAVWVIVRLASDEDGELAFETLTEDEEDSVYEEYERILAEEIDDEDDGDEDGDW
jgi:uncharacterized protein YrzB (UPF0473 family)